ncbi:MAG: ABC transporter permease [Actinobacteria bacterium HGW-Actinobacteria-4]|nr:MAG: ABC transporter permease [Actinobacteria bacterium HGW-Actinobacteria-4]
MTGAWTLVRFMLRRDRVRIPVWAVATGLGTMSSLGSLTETYGTIESRASIVATMENPAMVAMTGVNPAPDNYTFGAMMGHQLLVFTLVTVAIMSVLLMVRHTRAEEQTGRAELVRAAVVGRHATSFAAYKTVATANLAVAAALTVLLASQGVETIDWYGSLLYGAAHVVTGLVFASIALVTVQISEYSRGAAGMGLAAIGVAYVVRGVGDVAGNGLSWLSPFGWAQATRVYVDNRWWPLLIGLAFALVVAVIGMALSTRRDVGAGLKAPAASPATASAALSNPFGFALRLQRGMLIGWAVGLLFLGLSYGSVFADIETFFEDFEGLDDLLPGAVGADLTTAYMAMVMTVMAVMASSSAILAAQRLRSEESGGRAEPLLVAGLSRTRWVGSHVAVALVGGAIVMLAGGLGLGVAGAGSVGDWSILPDALAASAMYVPALWVVSAVGIALFGMAPRLVPWVWAIVAYSFVAVYLRALIGLPEALKYLSPFGHVPQFPAVPFDAVPLLVLTGIAAALIAIGVVGFRRRDLESTA